MTRQIYKNWAILYTNDLNEIHQEGDKPSIVYFHGHISFDKNYKLDRKGKPSKIYPDGSLVYYISGNCVKSIYA